MNLTVTHLITLIICFCFTFLLISELIQITGRDDTGRKRDDGHAEQRGKHADESADIRDGSQVAIADRGQRDRCPIQSVEEVIEGPCSGDRVDMRLGIEHDQRGEENVEDGDAEQGEEHPLLLLDDLPQHLNLFRIPDELEQAEYPQKTSDPEYLEPSSKKAENGEDRKQVNNGPGCKRINDESGPPFPLQPVIGCKPTQNIIQDKQGHRYRLHDPECPGLLLKHQGNDAHRDGDNHQHIIDQAFPLPVPGRLDDFKNPFSHRTALVSVCLQK